MLWLKVARVKKTEMLKLNRFSEETLLGFWCWILIKLANIYFELSNCPVFIKNNCFIWASTVLNIFSQTNFNFCFQKTGLIFFLLTNCSTFTIFFIRTLVMRRYEWPPLLEATRGVENDFFLKTNSIDLGYQKIPITV